MIRFTLFLLVALPASANATYDTVPLGEPNYPRPPSDWNNDAEFEAYTAEVERAEYEFLNPARTVRACTELAHEVFARPVYREFLSNMRDAQEISVEMNAALIQLIPLFTPEVKARLNESILRER